MRLLLGQTVAVALGENPAMMQHQETVGVGGIQHLGDGHGFARRRIGEGDLRQVAIRAGECGYGAIAAADLGGREDAPGVVPGHQCKRSRARD
jgi:hypothetical protein